ncbi:larval cuticle protein 2-like [Bactrocera oleae]|uniref:larval cuticle protein 2-like n=1 Tax=Bactrocera oleae TaxID=104688 RepID=UPI0006B722AA|nr:larval cuticle protein 2 isoform X1 [Bactrocera oleae]
MFKYVLLFAFVAYASAAAVSTSSDDAHAEVSLLTYDVRADGFDSALETSNSIHVVQHGDAKGNINGEYGWISPEGEHISVNYIADESGYHPQSELLPTAPPVPEAIVKALEYIAAHPPKDVSKN